jgi:DNA primase
MARIPTTEIERLKEEVSVECLAEGAGIALTKSGKDRLGRCPFHDDDQPSLTITPSKNLWHCFGCGLGGGPIDWVMKKQGVSFRHAVEILREGAAGAPAGAPAGASVVSPAVPSAAPSVSSLAADASAAATRPAKRSLVRTLAAPVAFDAAAGELLRQVIDYYHETLLASPEALAYLERRGLGGSAGRELIETHRLGYANRTLGLRLPVTRIKAGADIRARLQAIGVLRDSGHEHFNGCLVVPVFDAAGHVTEVYGRKITDGVNPPLHLYLPGPHCGVWNVRAFAGAGEIILCEALIDAMTFWHAGYRNVSASYGIEGFTDDHLQAFKAHGVRRILIAYDRDEPGERGAARLAERLIAQGLECYRIEFPKGMDANAYACRVTPAARSLGLAIRKAVWLGRGAAPAEGPGQRVESVGVERGAQGVAQGTAPEAVSAVPQVEPAAEAVPQVEPQTEPQAAPSLAAVPVATPAASPVIASGLTEVQVDTRTGAQANTQAAPASEALIDAQADSLVVQYGERRYRVRGLAQNLSYATLKINLLASRRVDEGEACHVDTFDLYAARARGQYVLHAAQELGVREDLVKQDLGRLLMKLEALQEARIQAALAPVPAAPAMTQAEEAEALALLRSPDLIERILTDFAACGIVGEATNKLTGYLAAVSRKLDHPLAVVIQSSSAAGKSSLMDAILALMPEEERIKYSAMTGQSLFYMGETNLQHKILAIVEEEGASKASYALKLLQSEGELTIASTGKDPTTGNLITQQYKVVGPVMIFLTTTAIEIDEELLNRCLVLSVDEDREQTRAIHRLQRSKRTLAGLQARQEKARLITLHQNAQRLLRSLAVVNPYADQLTFLDDRTRTRRDHEKYLTLIDAIALLHQHQRPLKSMAGGAAAGHAAVDYIEVIPADIARANALAHEVLGTSLDELPPQTRRLLTLIVAMVDAEAKAGAMRRADVRFTRKALRAHTGWGDTQLKLHLARLTELEHLIVHRQGHGLGQSPGHGGGFVYELLYDGDVTSGAHLSGLIDVTALQGATVAPGRTYDANRSGVNGARSAPGRPVVEGRSGTGRPDETAGETQPPTIPDDSPSVTHKPHVLGGNGLEPSYLRPLPLAAGSAR